MNKLQQTQTSAESFRNEIRTKLKRIEDKLDFVIDRIDHIRSERIYSNEKKPTMENNVEDKVD